MTWSSNRSWVTEEELFEEATLGAEDIFREVYFRFFKAGGDDGRYNRRYLGVDGSLPWVREQRHRAKGRCFTFTPEAWMKQLGIYYWKFIL